MWRRPSDTEKEPEVKQIRFDTAVENGVNVYRYLPGADVPVEVHWGGLHQEWPEEPTPWTEYAVSNDKTEEIAVYLGLIWRVTAGLDRYGIATYYRDEAASIRNQCSSTGSTRPPRTKRIPADAIMDSCPAGPASRSGPRRPPGSPNTRPRQACSASLNRGTWSGCCKRPCSTPPLRSSWSASHADLTARLHHLAADYDQRIAGYEATAAGLPGIPAFLAAMQDLTGIGA
jgi:hypothetical protein